MNPTASQSLINLLLESGVSSTEEAAQLAVNLNGGSWVGQILDSGKVDEHRFLSAIGNSFRVPVVSIDPKKIDRTTLSILPSRFVFQHHILPIDVKENSVVLATYDLFNSIGRQLAAQLLKKPAEWVLVPRTQLLRAMKTLYGIGAETFDEILKTNRAFEVLQDAETAIELNADDPEASVVKFVNQIIREAIFERATDIHVEPLENDLRIRYRIDGILHEVAVPPQLRVLQSAIISRLKVMAHMDIAERRLPQDGRMNLQANNQNIDVRVSTIPTVNGESISLRLLSRSEQQFGFDRLDLSKKQETTIRSLLAQPNGIILLTGPTGCGKSTSLYCFLSSINSVQRRIITIEEPVEYRLPGVSQIDVKPEIDLTFAKGLRHILRQDPNVVMVGEIRDIETADIAIRAAMTGHLVFSTLHTNDAVGGITRLLDMEVEPFLLASVVKAFIAQRLVRTICPDCLQLVDYPPEYLAQIGFPVKELGTRFRRGAGCDQCRQTGYQGRAAIYEICLVTEPLRKLIMRKCDGGELKQCAIAEGMETLRQDGWRRVAQGKTTIEEVVRVTQTDEVMAETTEEAEPVVAAESAGEVLAEIETDRATMEWESPEDRTPAEIYVEEGGKVNVGDKIAFIGGDGEEARKEEEKGKEEKEEKPEAEREKEEEKGKPKKEEAKKEPQKKAERPKNVEKQSIAEKKAREKAAAAKGKKTAEKRALKIKKAEEARVKASPVARRIAAGLGVALASVKRTGRKGV